MLRANSCPTTVERSQISRSRSRVCSSRSTPLRRKSRSTSRSRRDASASSPEPSHRGEDVVQLAVQAAFRDELGDLLLQLLGGGPHVLGRVHLGEHADDGLGVAHCGVGGVPELQDVQRGPRGAVLERVEVTTGGRQLHLHPFGDEAGPGGSVDGQGERRKQVRHAATLATHSWVSLATPSHS